MNIVENTIMRYSWRRLIIAAGAIFLIISIRFFLEPNTKLYYLCQDLKQPARPVAPNVKDNFLMAASGTKPPLPWWILSPDPHPDLHLFIPSGSNWQTTLQSIVSVIVQGGLPLRISSRFVRPIR
jgi:hypothetical protein